MLTRLMFWLILIATMLLIDVYIYQAVLTVTSDLTSTWKQIARYGFWLPTVICVSIILYYVLGNPDNISHTARSFLLTGFFAIYFSKLFGIVILFMDDLHRGVKWVARLFYRGASGEMPGEAISRSEFLAKTALVASAIPFGAMAYGVISGAHDYRVRRKTIYLPNLPKSFDGITIGQLSDIHSGSFFNKTAVRGGVEMFLREKPDVIFFTGDLVNNEAAEVNEYIDVFGKLKAPLGVFSVTGNHDYGDYRSWPSSEAKSRNLKDFFAAHKQMGFNLLMNENRRISVDGEQIAVLGIENWGAGRFTKYGRLNDAYKGSEDAPVKLLLSHDPSHWDAQVRPLYPDIDIAFAGHTHGFQFGVEIGNFKWSPSQYVYKQWAGLYQEGSQYLYVNRGFGYLGYPGRIGMPPELTIIELKRS
jgi:predicted MPP superfamily phosphohydrolase